jgi:hypothetical protein
MPVAIKNTGECNVTTDGGIAEVNATQIDICIQNIGFIPVK